MRSWMRGSPMVIGHRGARGLVQHENTVASFEEAVRLGVDMIEFDVRRTGDGELVCFHDAELGGVVLAEMTYAQLLEKTKAIGYEAPLLEEVLHRFKGRVRFDVELKEPGYEALVLEVALREVGRADFVIKSFYDSVVLATKKAERTVSAGLLLGVDGPKVSMGRVREFFPELRLAKCRADFVSPHYALARLGFVKRMHGLGLPVYVWTVNDVRVMRRLWRAKVDAIITDRPDLALKLLGR